MQLSCELFVLHRFNQAQLWNQNDSALNALRTLPHFIAKDAERISAIRVFNSKLDLFAYEPYFSQGPARVLDKVRHRRRHKS